MAADKNAIIFNRVRAWLKPPGYGTPGLIAILDAACADYLETRDKKVIFDALRPYMDGDGFKLQDRIAALDAACDQFLAAAAAGAGWWDVAAPPTHTAPAQASKQHSIEQFITGYIGDHEGGLSMDPADNGNWTGGHRGVGKLVGSKFGVTPGAIATYRGVPASSIDKADIAALTRDEAVAIGVKNYYRGPGFDKLPWNRVTLSIVDKGWGSGPGKAIQLLQRMLGLTVTGKLNPETIAAYAEFVGRLGEEAAARKWADVRIAFDTSLGQPRFINGWNNRTRSFLPGTKWWQAWG